MRDVWSVAQIRAAEEALIDRVGGNVVMQRAAYGLAVHCGQILGRRYGARVVLLVGAGNNGGDALYAGALLAGRGASVHAVLFAPERVHVGGVLALVDAGGTTGIPDGARPLLDGADLVVDGIVGIGGRGALRSPADDLLRDLGAPVVAVDVPSGVDADTGRVAGAAVAATATVTFGGLKAGLVVGAGADRSGAVHEVDIGLRPHLGEPAARILQDADVAALLPVPGPGDDKYSRGVVGVASGSSSYEGAAVLSVGGALRAKAGLVRYAGYAVAGVRARWPEAVVTEGRPGAAGRVQAWVVGPGLGTDEQASGLVREVLAADVPVLVDADGLTVLAGELGLLRGRRAPTLLTPHDREFERLFGPVGHDRLGAARRAAADSGAVVLLKGQATIVAGPDGRALVNPTGSGWLATAGTGDVLSGVAGALLAAGLDPLDAAGAAAYLHGLAGGLAAGAGYPAGLPAIRARMAELLVIRARMTVVERGAPIVASDVIEALPAAWRSVRSGGAPGRRW